MRKLPAIAVIDCETDPFAPGRFVAPFVWGYFDGLEFRYFEQDHIEQFVAFVSERKQIVYAHNGGRFDYIFLKPYIRPGQSVMVINGRVAKFKIGKAEFRDSWNIIPAPLSVYKKTEIDYSKMERANRYKTDTWREIISYLRDDCVNLHELVTRFVERYGMKLTQAGASMNEWQRISGQERIEDSGPEFFEEFRAYYYGGRVECFRSGIVEERFKVLDINSAYPYAMMHAHPHGLDYARRKGFAPVASFYRLRARSTGAFPFRADSGRLDFPSDGVTREFFVTHWEYHAAEQTGTLEECSVIESYIWAAQKDFADYVTHFYRERLAAKEAKDAVGDLFAKLFMNSLYGKFAADPSKYRNYEVLEAIDDPERLRADQSLEFVGDFGGHVLVGRELPFFQRRYYNVATAASITGFVRSMLWEAICASGRDAMLYCDTDSIATKRIGEGIKLGRQLGEWKDEGDFVRAGIAGKKLYVFTRAKKDPRLGLHKIASKGAKLTPRQIYKVARGGVVDYLPLVATYSALSEPKFTRRKIKSTI